MALSFDGPNKRIVISAATTLSVRDAWSRAVDWWLTSDNSKYVFPMAQVGGNDIDASEGTKIPIYAFLQSGWRVQPMSSDHTLKVQDGVILVDGGGDPFVTPPSGQVRIVYQQPVQAISFSSGGGGGATAAEIWEYGSRTLTTDIAAVVWQRLLESGLTAEQYQRIMMAALTGKTTGIGSPTETYRDVADTKPRLSVTFDEAGNRVAVTRDGA